MAGCKLVDRHGVDEEIAGLIVPTSWLLRPMTEVGCSDLYLVHQDGSTSPDTRLDSNICGTLDAMPETLAIGDQWPEWQLPVSKYFTQISSLRPHIPYFPRERNSTTRAAGIPCPRLCIPSSPPSKAVRLHSHSDHCKFSSWNPGPHQRRSWGWNINKSQGSWGDLREVLVLVWMGLSIGR
jgi:hypothetical protein